MDFTRNRSEGYIGRSTELYRGLFRSDFQCASKRFSRRDLPHARRGEDVVEHHLPYGRPYGVRVRPQLLPRQRRCRAPHFELPDQIHPLLRYRRYAAQRGLLQIRPRRRRLRHHPPRTRHGRRHGQLPHGTDRELLLSPRLVVKPILARRDAASAHLLSAHDLSHQLRRREPYPVRRSGRIPECRRRTDQRGVVRRRNARMHRDDRPRRPRRAEFHRWAGADAAEPNVRRRRADRHLLRLRRLRPPHATACTVSRSSGMLSARP